MSLKKITYAENDQSLGQLGGGAWLSDIALWPTDPDTGELMLPLMTLTSRFLGTPFLADGMAMTVFISVRGDFKRSALRKFTVHRQDELEGLKKGYSQVLVHPLASVELQPDLPLINRKFIDLSAFDEADLQEELEDDTQGAGMSKVLGRPCWLQDPIYETPRYYFLAQLQERDIRAISPAHEGLFAEGTGYLFADNRSQKITQPTEGGYFFIQFT